MSNIKNIINSYRKFSTIDSYEILQILEKEWQFKMFEAIKAFSKIWHPEPELVQAILPGTRDY